MQLVNISSLNGEDLTAGTFVLVYLGDANPRPLVQTRLNSPEISILSSDTPLPRVNDFLVIGGVVYQIAGVKSLLNITLSTPIVGGSTDIVEAVYAAYPSSNLRYNATASEVEGHLQSQLVPNITSGPWFNFTNLFSVAVQRSSVGRSFYITFTGEMFSQEQPLLMPLSFSNSTFTVVNLTAFGTLHAPNFARTEMGVRRLMTADSLSPGTSVFIRVSALNSVGQGPSKLCLVSKDGTSAGSIVPRSPPGLPKLPLVFSPPLSKGAFLKVTWSMGENFGGTLMAFGIEWIVAPFAVWSGFQSVMIPVSQLQSNTSFEWYIPVTRNHSYSVRVRQYNDIGPSPPAWYAKVTSSTPLTTAFSTAADFHDGSQIALPTCTAGLDECVENSSTVILARGLPGYPVLTVPAYLQQVAGPSFSRSWVIVYFNEPSPNGGYVDKYRIEWDEFTTFSSPMLRTAVTSASQFNITNLSMGVTYYIRVFAHTSIGFGSSSAVYSFIPIQQPDPPLNPSLQTADGSTSLVEFATSLNVSWSYPAVFGPDEVGDGGNTVASYLIEWAKLPFSAAVPTIQSVVLTTTSQNSSTAFSLELDSPGKIYTVNSSVSAFIPITASAGDLQLILENMPNVAEVQVSKTVVGSISTYLITFSEINDVPLLKAGPASSDFASTSTLSISKVQNASFPGSSYSFDVVSASPGTYAQSYLITGLSPGELYYARVSAANALGYGARRLTGPPSLAVPVTQPSNPTQYEGPWGAPRVFLTGPSSVLLEIGPPEFGMYSLFCYYRAYICNCVADGGSLVTHFTVEWDTSSRFNSNPDGSQGPLGQANVPAYEVLCSACVSSIELPSASNSYTLTVYYSGNATDAQLLQVGKRLAIVTTDDHVPYLFTVSDSHSTPSSFHVASSSLRHSNFNGSFTGAADLLLLGTRFPISGLSTGSQYFFRLNAVNSIGKCPLFLADCGAFTMTVPPSLVVTGPPSAPVNLVAHVINAQSVWISWTRPEDVGSFISAYRLDAYTMSSQATADFSFFGDTEVQILSTANSLVTGGTFTVAFNSFSVLLPANVSAKVNSYFFSTTVDITPYIDPGDQVLIDGVTYTVDSHGINDNTGFFVTTLIKSSTLQNLMLQPVYSRPRTVPIDFDVSPVLLRSILQSTPGFGEVWVDRTVLGSGFEWMVTFLTNPGRQPLLVTNPGNLIGPNPAIAVSEVRQGTLPNNFKSEVLSANSDSMNVTLSGLFVGVAWYFRVLAINQVGVGPFSEPVSAVPAYVPGSPSFLTIQSASGSSILATFAQDADPAGSPVIGYRLSIQNSAYLLPGSTMSRRVDASNTTVFLPINYTMQKIQTSAFALPFAPGATFKLSVASFFGVFNTYVGKTESLPGSFDAVDGASFVTRSATDPSVFHPHVEVTPGEFINIASQQFRVCLNQDSNFVSTYGSLSIVIIPLCLVDDPYAAAFIQTGYKGKVLLNTPVYRLDTYVGGVNSPLLGSSSIIVEFYDGALNIASASLLSVGDWIRSYLLALLPSFLIYA